MSHNSTEDVMRKLNEEKIGGNPKSRRKVEQPWEESGYDMHTSHQKDSKGFPFLDLPRELRDQIYSYATETRAEFFHTCRHPPTERYSAPSPSRSGLQWDDADREECEDGEEPILYFRLTRFTPLLLVCKQINFEVQQLSESFNLPTVRSLIRYSIHGDVIASDSPPEFERICERSRFVFDACALHTSHSLKNLRNAIKRCIRSIVLTKDSLTYRKSRTAISRFREYGAEILFDLSTQKKFPNWKEVAFYVPDCADNSISYCESVSAKSCLMLLQGKLDVVRFIYPSSKPRPRAEGSFRPEDCYILSKYINERASGNDGAGEEKRRKLAQRYTATLEYTGGSEEGRPYLQATSYFSWPGASTVIAVQRRGPPIKEHYSPYASDGCILYFWGFGEWDQFDAMK